MTPVQEAQDQLNSKHREWLALFDNRPGEMKPEDQVKRLGELNGEMSTIAERIKELATKAALDAQASQYRDAVASYNTPVRRPPFADGADPETDRKDAAENRPATLGDAFIDSIKRKGWEPGRTGQTVGTDYDAGYGFKATFTTTGSTLTGYDRQPGIVTLGVQVPSVADLFAQGRTTLNTIRYIREDTFTNAATTVAEGAAKPEATFDTSEVDAPVRKIAVTAKVTDELFNDYPAIRDYINERLPLMVRMHEDAQLLTGDGVAPNLTGVLNTAGILTQAKGGDPTPDAVYKAMVKVMSTGFFMPDGAVFHPLDWQDVKLLRTADGLYIWGNPADAAPDRIWGLRVALTTSMTQNTALVGAFKLGGQIFYREGIRVEATNTNADDFVNNLITIRAEQREALVIYRPSAYCTVTGV